MSKSWHLYAATLALLIGCKQEVCNNNLDDDGNGAIDCDDDACSADAACGPRCGDGIANAGEDCDGGDLNGTSCVSLGADSGTLTCNTACQFDQSQCVNGVCGDNAVDQGEDCDGNNLGGASCLSLGLEDGVLVCDGTCQFNSTGCGTNIACGNNIVEVGEQCDDGCLSGTPNVCEAIDNGDGCSSACQTEVVGTGGLVINEVDYDQFNSDTASFVEIFNGTNAAVNLTGLSLVFINGSNSTEYGRVDLNAAGSLNGGQFLVVGNDTVVSSLPGAIKTISQGTDDFLQNGAPDGILLINSANQVLDSLSYEGPLTAVTLTGGASVSFSDTGFDGTDTNGDGVGEDFNAIARKTDGVDTNNGNADWAVVTPGTPGAANP